MAKAPTSKNTVEITGLDNLLIRLEGKFSVELDRKILSTRGSFVRAMDQAASRVFTAMAKDVSVGGIVARRVMGSHASTPSYLLTNGASAWEKLDPKYMKRKKAMSGNRKYWQYTGKMIEQFRETGTEMARISGNVSRYANTGDGTYRDLTKKDPKDRLFLPNKSIPAYGRNKGTRSYLYDFEYSLNDPAPKVNYSARHKTLSGKVPESSVVQMKRQLEFDVFHGFARYMAETLEGRVSASPEDYVGVLYSGSQKVSKPRSGTADLDKVGSDYERRVFLKYKLYYRKKGQEYKKRELIQPYMKYFYNKVMIPLAEKTIKGLKV